MDEIIEGIEGELPADGLPAEEEFPVETYPAEDDPAEDWLWLDDGSEVVEGDPGEGDVAIEIWPEELPPDEWGTAEPVDESVEILYLEDPAADGEATGEDGVYDDVVYDDVVYDDVVYDYGEVGDDGEVVDDGVVYDIGVIGDLPVDYKDLVDEGRPVDAPSDEDLIFYATGGPELYYTAVQRDVVSETAFGADRGPPDFAFTSHDLRSAEGGPEFHMV